MTLQSFYPGESAGVAEVLNANFNYLLNLIQGTIGNQLVGVANGSGSAIGISQSNEITAGYSNGNGFAFARTASLSNSQLIGTASGATGSDVGNIFEFFNTVGTSSGTGNALGIFSSGTAMVGTASGATGTDIAVSNSKIQSIGNTSAGTGGNLAITNIAQYSQGIAGGATGTDIGYFLNNVSETAAGTYAQIGGSILYASNAPGAIPTGSLNSFVINASLQVTFNGVADTATKAIQLYYASHTLYYENLSGQWFSWTNGGTPPLNTWTAVASPVPATVYESVNGTIFSAAGQTIYASSTYGSAAPTTATVANGGLITFSMSANPGVVIGGVPGNGQPDNLTANVTQIAYFNHYFYQYGNGAWYQYMGPSGDYNNYTGPVTSPIPTSRGLAVQTIPQQMNQQAFTVSGAYADWTSSSSLNLIHNSTPADDLAVAGTPGTLPQYWGNSIPGLTQTIVGFGTDSTTLYPYIDIRLVGTPTSSAAIYFDTTTGITVAANTAYYHSAYIALVGGSNTNVTNVGLAVWEYAAGGVYTKVYSVGAVTPTATPTFCGFTFTTSATAVSARPSFLLNLTNGNPIDATYRLIVPMLNAGTTTIGFIPTPISTTAPTLQYRDLTGTWQPIISASNVTSTNWSFVHPPYAAGYTNNAQTITVRDANVPTVTATSNQFQVASSGVTTIQNITVGGVAYTNGGVAPPITLAGGSAVGTQIETLSVPVSPGTFSGAISVTPAAYGYSNGYLVNTAVLGTGNSGTITITATQAGAVNSPMIVTQSVTVTAESANGKVLTSPGSGTITGSGTPGSAGSNYVWSLSGTAGSYYAAVSINGGATTVQTGSTANVAQLYYINHTLYQQNTSLNWWYFNGTGVTGSTIASSGWTSCLSPIPVITVDVANVPVTTFPSADKIGDVAGTLTMTTQGPITGGTGTIVLHPTWSITGTTEFAVNAATGDLTLTANATADTTYSFTAVATY